MTGTRVASAGSRLSVAAIDGYRPAIAVLIIVVGIALAYRSACNVPFVFDDRPGVERNESIRQLTALGQVLQPPVTAAGAAGRPVVNLTLAINYAVGKLNPSGYHAFNVGLHAVNALLLFAVLIATLRRTHRWHNRAVLPSATVALLWAVHPLTTESVVCVIQRNELLATFFQLVTLYAFIRSVGPESRRGVWQTVSVTACLLGMASKETMVGAPLLVLLYDRAFVTQGLVAIWKARWKYYVCLGATWLLLVFLVLANQQRAGTVGFGLGTSPWQYLVTQCDALCLYLKLAAWPHPLVLDYGFDLAAGLASVWPQAVLVVALLMATVIGCWCNRAWAFVGAAFFILLAPSSSIIPLTTQTIAEHRMYLPLAAIIVVAVLSMHIALRRGLWLAVVCALPLLALTNHRVHTYRSERAIWVDTIAERPGNARAWSSLANVLVRQNRWPEAASLYAKAIALRPDYADTQNDYANVLLHLGRAEEALTHYSEAHRLKPEDDDIQLNYADALAQTGDLRGAMAQREAVLARDPSNFRANNGLGDALLKSSDPAAALVRFKAALAADPGSAIAHNNAAVALMNLGRYTEAVSQYQAALRELNGSATVHHNLALALDGAGRLEDAARQEIETLKLDPENERAREHLAQLRARGVTIP